MAPKSLRRVLALQPLLAILLPGIAVFIGILWLKPQIQLEIESRQQQLARAVGMQVEGYLESGAALIKAAAAIKAEQELLDRGQAYQLQLKALLESSETISSIYVVDEQGRVSDVAIKKGVRDISADLIGLDLSNNPLFKALAESGKPRWSKTILSVVHGGLVTAYGVRSGNLTLIGEVDLGFLTQFLQQITTESDLMIMVIDHVGQVVADNNGLYTAQQLNISNIDLVMDGFAADALTTGRMEFSGVKMTGSILPLPSVNWHVLVAKPDTSLYRTVWDISTIVLGGVLCAFVVGIVSSLILAQVLASRFKALTAHAQRIAHGETAGQHWPSSSIDEFSQLSESLQLMARRLQDSELLYRTLFEELPDGVVLWSPEGKQALKFNAAACESLGYSPEEFSCLSVKDVHVSESERQINEISAALKMEGIARFEAYHRTKSGERRFMAVTLRQVDLADQPMILGIHRDITEERKNIEEIKNINRLLGVFVHNSPIYTFIKDVTEKESRVLLASENYQQMIGIPGSQMAGKTMQELFPEELAASMTADDWKVVSEGEVLELEEELNGRIYSSIKFPIIQGERTLLAGYTIDITERKQAEDERLGFEKQLLHVQKLESLGVLAGGIAHDFNNILLAIIGNADMATRRLEQGRPAQEYLQRIRQAADKAADLARQMLAYSGKGKFKVEVVDLNLLLEEMLQMLKVSISKKVFLQLELSEALPVIEADATQMRQVVMNLVINASEAIGDTEGVITIKTSTGSCPGGGFLQLQPKAKIAPGNCICLEIADNGCGMDEGTLSKLFDPFFTTKFTGRGLGMSAVQGIVRGHQGTISVESTPGKGTCFRIFLPASSKSLTPVEAGGGQCLWRGQGKVLLVDDEETVRNVGSEMIQELGFEVITANDGVEGLEKIRAMNDIVLVILDLTMPRMDGVQCFAAMREFNPELKILMSSGYSEQESARQLLGQGLVGFVQKPYTFDMLLDAMQKALQEN